MRVFFDTNVLISAFTTRGLCADVMRVVLARHTLVVGEVVLEEFVRVMDEKFGCPAARLDAVTTYLRGFAVVPRPEEPAPVAGLDTDDAWVLGNAIAARADVLVTGDRDLLDVAGKAGIQIVDPRGFWEGLRPPR